MRQAGAGQRNVVQVGGHGPWSSWATTSRPSCRHRERPRVAADLSLNDVRDLRIERGRPMPIALPPERLHVFARHPGGSLRRRWRPGRSTCATLPTSQPRPADAPEALAATTASCASISWLLAFLLGLTVLLPLVAVLAKSVQGPDGSFVGLANFRRFFANPALAGSVANSLLIAALSTAICVAAGLRLRLWPDPHPDAGPGPVPGRSPRSRSSPLRCCRRSAWSTSSATRGWPRG